MPQQADIVDQMRQALRIAEPELDTSIGTTTRKVLDAVGEQVAEAYSDGYLLNYVYDIDAKIGDDLDDFVALFGFNRFPARRATGTVTFVRRSVATNDVFVPTGSQVSTESGIIFVTTSPAVIPQGETEVTVSSQAAQGGLDGNVTAGAVNRRVSALGGIDNLINVEPFTGGTDAETDEQLRSRFKLTVFRRLAGTRDMYLGVALENPNTSRAVVIGSSLSFTEQIELTGSPAAATSTVPDAKSIYPESVFLGTSLDSESIFMPGPDFDFNTASLPPVITSTSINVPAGVYELTFDYIPTASRNDFDDGVFRKVDIYVDGIERTDAVETRKWDTSKILSNSTASPNYIGNWVRRAFDVAPVVGNYLIPLSFMPVLDVADIITIGGADYHKNVDYWVVRNTTVMGGSTRTVEGLEWSSAVSIPTGTTFTIEYTYNSVPGDTETALREWRLVTEDSMVHEAYLQYLVLNLIVILSSGYSVEMVRPVITERLNRLLTSTDFNGWLQASDILSEVHLVPGVDAVRFMNDDDDINRYAIQRVTSNWDPLTPLPGILTTYNDGGSPARVVDVHFTANKLPVLSYVHLVVKAPNTFGAS